MHATIPVLPEGILQLLACGAEAGERDGILAGLLDRGAGTLLAHGMAKLIELGFSFLACDKLDVVKKTRARGFFEENFVMNDPEADRGVRYYQGKFLIRTTKPEDDMNVYIRFCPDIERLFDGDDINPMHIVEAEALTEEEAEEIERDPERLDLVIRFKDIKAILGLIERANVGPVQLLLENQVQLTGNFGHMFKFGAIGKNVQLALEGDAANLNRAMENDGR